MKTPSRRRALPPGNGRGPRVPLYAVVTRRLDLVLDLILNFVLLQGLLPPALRGCSRGLPRRRRRGKLRRRRGLQRRRRSRGLCRCTSRGKSLGLGLPLRPAHRGLGLPLRASAGVALCRRRSRTGRLRARRCSAALDTRRTLQRRTLRRRAAPLRARLLVARQPREGLGHLTELARQALEASAEAGRAGGRGGAGGLRLRGVATSPSEQLAPPLVAVELLRRDQLLAELARQL